MKLANIVKKVRSEERKKNENGRRQKNMVLVPHAVVRHPKKIGGTTAGQKTFYRSQTTSCVWYNTKETSICCLRHAPLKQKSQKLLSDKKTPHKSQTTSCVCSTTCKSQFSLLGWSPQNRKKRTRVSMSCVLGVATQTRRLRITTEILNTRQQNCKPSGVRPPPERRHPAELKRSAGTDGQSYGHL